MIRPSRALRWMLVLALAALLAWTVSPLGLRSWTGPVAAPSEAPPVIDPLAASTSHSPAAAAPAVASLSARSDSPGASETHSTRERVAPRPAQAGSKISAAEARERMRRVDAERDCEQAAYAVSEQSTETLEWHYWRWLPAEQAAHERAARAAAAARLGRGCAALPTKADAKRRRQSARDADVAAALATGDLLARLRDQRAYPDPSATDLERTRALLYDVLLSGDVELIAQIGLQRNLLNSAQPAVQSYLIDNGAIWQLVACDLGRECGATSRALDRMCLYTTSAACGAASVEAAVQLTHHHAVYALMDQRRREIVARIRSGQIAGIFDPPPATTAGGKP